VLRLQCDDVGATDSIESAVLTPSAFAELFQHITGIRVSFQLLQIPVLISLSLKWSFSGQLSVDQTLLFRGFFDTHQGMSLV
jgi:hypothetical protein